jgi:hypothetical protein
MKTMLLSITLLIVFATPSFSEVGKYQLAVSGKGDVLVIDTETGDLYAIDENKNELRYLSCINDAKFNKTLKEQALAAIIERDNIKDADGIIKAKKAVDSAFNK